MWAGDFILRPFFFIVERFNAKSKKNYPSKSGSTIFFIPASDRKCGTLAYHKHKTIKFYLNNPEIN